MNATNTPILIATEIGPWFVKTFEDATVKAYRMMWDAFIPAFAANWIWIILILFLVFTLVSLKAFMGRWSSLGSFLYNISYFGMLLVIGLIWGPEVFAGDLFKVACTVILYPICYWLSGYIMEKMGVRHRYF